MMMMMMMDGVFIMSHDEHLQNSVSNGTGEKNPNFVSSIEPIIKTWKFILFYIVNNIVYLSIK